MSSHPRPTTPAAPVASFEPLEDRRLLAVDVTLDAGTRFQTIDGFGTMAPPYTSGNMAMYYDDLGSSIVRIALNARALRAAGDNQYATPVTPVQMVEDINQNIAKLNFNASRVGDPLNVVRESKTRAPGTKWIGSIWSPPHWMKGPELNATGNSYRDDDPNTPGTQYRYPQINYFGNDSSGGSLIDTHENLTQFARYVAAWVKGAEQATGVPFYAISIQNELAFWEPYDSCVYNPTMYVKALKYVSAEFDKWGITTNIQGPEDVGVGSTSDPWVLWRQFEYINAVRADPVANAQLDIYSIHGYANDGINANRSPEMWRQYWDGRSQQQYPNPAGAWWTGIKNDGKPSWMTETSGEPHTWDGAMLVAANAMDALNHSNVSAWVYWQGADGGSTPTQYTLTANGDTTPKKYNAAKHIFKHVRPGAQRINATPSNPNGIYVSAFVHDQQKTATVVLMNYSNTTDTVNLSKLGSGLSGLTSFDVARRTTASETWTNLGPVSFNASGVATISLPARSIITLSGSTAAVAPVIVPSATRVRVVEGATASFGVRLDRQPTDNVTLAVARAAGDADVSVSGGATLTFTPANWNAPQTVTLAAAHDADTTDGTATIRLSATGLAAVDVTAVEVDDDAAADATIPRVTAAPAVDGHVDAVWNAVAAHAIGRTLSGTFAGGSDLTATWRAVYTDQRLYLLVDVTDDQLRNDSTNPWDDDAVELYLDGDASRGTSYDGSNDLQLVFGYGDAAVVGGTNSAAGGTAGVTFATVPTATGYRLEASVPWQPNLGNPDLAVGQRLGIDVHVNDDDDGGGRDGKRAWTAATDNAWANPSLFGTAKLGGTVTADTTPPTVVSSSFDYQTGHRVLVRFSEDVSASLQAGDLTVQIVGGTTTQPLAATAVAYDPATFTATFAYTPPLADGNYRATLAAGAVTDAAGNPLASSHTLDFYVLAGDFNRDRVADFADLGILLNNYNTTGKTFSQGDANYDGAVDFADLGILLNSYNKSLLAPATTSVLEAEPTPPVVTTSTPQPPAKAKPPKVKPRR